MRNLPASDPMTAKENPASEPLPVRHCGARNALFGFSVNPGRAQGAAPWSGRFGPVAELPRTRRMSGPTQSDTAGHGRSIAAHRSAPRGGDPPPSYSTV